MESVKEGLMVACVTGIWVMGISSNNYAMDGEEGGKRTRKTRNQAPSIVLWPCSQALVTRVGVLETWDQRWNDTSPRPRTKQSNEAPWPPRKCFFLSLNISWISDVLKVPNRTTEDSNKLAGTWGILENP